MRAYVFRWNQDTRHRSKLESYIAARAGMALVQSALTRTARALLMMAKARASRLASWPACAMRAWLKKSWACAIPDGSRTRTQAKPTRAAFGNCRRVTGKRNSLPAMKTRTRIIASLTRARAVFRSLPLPAMRRTRPMTWRAFTQKASASMTNDGRKLAASPTNAKTRGTIKAMRHVARDIIRAWRDQLKTGPLSPAVCGILRADLEEAREHMRTAIEEARNASARIAELDMAGEF